MTRQEPIPGSFLVKHKYFLLTLFALALASGYLLYPALFFDRSLVHADNLHHGYALLKFHHDVIHQGLSPLWTNLVYGGHALFAEGQAGLSNPFNYLVAWLLPPTIGHNLLHWLAMTAFGIGCYGLCRSLSISPASAMFAALAATFSSLTIHSNTNLTAIEAMVWIPWTLWAFEAWLDKPNANRAILFGLSTSMLVFSGYPHFLHGTVIYMIISLWSLFQGRSGDSVFKARIGKYFTTGFLAIAVCAGLSSIQWLPLLELASLSHRREGAGDAWIAAPEFIFRGLIYSTQNTAATGNDPYPYFPNVGSLAICVLASLGLVLSYRPRIGGHIAATLLLLNLGLGEVSPIYKVIAKLQLIPGLDSFRILFPYFLMSIVGTAVLAANSLDALAKWGKESFKQFSPGSALRWSCVVLFWCYFIYTYHTADAPLTNYLILACGAALMVTLTLLNKAYLLPLGAVLLLLWEIFALKLAPFGTIDNRALTSKPPSVEYIVAQDNAHYFKHFHIGLVALTFSSPYYDKLEARFNHELSSIVASTNLLWGIPSFSAALALKSYRKPEADQMVMSEIEGLHGDQLGHRLMDVLSIRWISKDNTNSGKHLIPIKDAQGKFIVWENPYAHPLIQTYRKVQVVEGPQQAIKGFATNSSKTLFVEADAGSLLEEKLLMPNKKIHLKTQKVSATHYSFHSSSAAGYWLFLSDTYYPGWKATIDTKPVKVYPAQILGKTIFVPPGEHSIEVFFQSDSFRLGATASCLTVLGLSLYAARLVFNRRRLNAHKRTG